MHNYKVLVISYDYYPDNSPNTYRWHNVLKVWASEGYEVYVVAAQKAGFSQYQHIDGIHIHRTGKSWLEIIKTRFKKNDQGKMDTSGQNLISKESILKKIYNNTFKLFYFPDFAFLWRSPGELVAKGLIKKHNINNVITVSWPFTDHVIGYRLRKKIEFNWIADSIDPYYLSDAVNNSFLYKSAKFRLEKKILSNASFITVLTNKLKEKYMALYPEIKDRIVINHNVFIPYKFKQCDNGKEGNTIKLVFLGTLTPKTRSPKLLLQLMDKLSTLSTLSKIELHFYGDSSQCRLEFELYSNLIGKCVFLHGLISKDEVKQVGIEADVLVNIGNSNEYQEPSKILEYIYIEKPVLNICSIINDSSKEVLDNYPLNFNFYANDLDNKLVIGELEKFLKSDNRALAEHFDKQELLKEYLLPEVQSRYAALLKAPN